MSSFMDVWQAVTAVFTSADMITLAIMVVIVLAAGFVMQGFESIVTTTFVALILFGLAGYVRAVVLNGQNAAQLAETRWHDFLGMTAQSLIAYALAFAVAIGVVHLVRSIVIR